MTLKTMLRVMKRRIYYGLSQFFLFRVDSSRSVTFVTAADHSHFLSLIRAVKVARHYSPTSEIIVYDLGLNKYQRAVFHEQFKDVDLVLFQFNEYPPHLDIRFNVGEYAWKPQIVWEVARSRNGILCWFDAGTFFLTDTSWIFAAVSKTGFYSGPFTSGTIETWTHPSMLDRFAVPKSDLDKPNLNGAFICFDLEREQSFHLLQQWANLALDKETIAPEGSSRANHRQDQALLTVLAYQKDLVQTKSLLIAKYRIATHMDIDEDVFHDWYETQIPNFSNWCRRMRLDPLPVE